MSRQPIYIVRVEDKTDPDLTPENPTRRHESDSAPDTYLELLEVDLQRNMAAVSSEAQVPMKTTISSSRSSSPPPLPGTSRSFIQSIISNSW